MLSARGSGITIKNYLKKIEKNRNSLGETCPLRLLPPAYIPDRLSLLLKSAYRASCTYHRDHNIGTGAITSDAGEIVQKNQYSSFGKIVSIKDKERRELGITKAVDQPFYYTGREWDEEIELYYYRARSFDPVQGRFIQKDPIGLNGGDTNLYRYVSNKPVRFTDPLGLLTFEENLAIRRSSNENMISDGVKAGASLAIGTAFNTAARRELGLGVGVLEAYRNSFNISTLGTAGTVGNFVTTAAVKTITVNISFTVGQEIGNVIGAALDTHVDNMQGNGENSIFESLYFGSGQPNVKNKCKK